MVLGKPTGAVEMTTEETGIGTGIGGGVGTATIHDPEIASTTDDPHRCRHAAVSPFLLLSTHTFTTSQNITTNLILRPAEPRRHMHLGEDGLFLQKVQEAGLGNPLPYLTRDLIRRRPIHPVMLLDHQAKLVRKVLVRIDTHAPRRVLHDQYPNADLPRLQVLSCLMKHAEKRPRVDQNVFG